MSFSQKLIDALINISSPKLKDIAGEGLVETAITLDPEAGTKTSLISLIQDLHEPHKLLSNLKYRDYIFQSLKIEDAIELSKKFNDYNVSQTDPYEFLSDLPNTKRIKNTLFEHFDIPEPSGLTDYKFDIDPLKKIEPIYALYDYQNRAVEESIEILSRETKNNLLIHMPTGSGKTRTAMHLISRILNQRPNKVVVWLAHSEELCEQAAEEFEKAWENLGNRSISIGRFYDKNEFDLSAFKEGIIVAGLNKLFLRTSSQQRDFLEMQKNVTLVVFDEAHQAIAETYKFLVNMLTIGGNLVNLVGLTATPGRAILEPEKTEELANLFDRNKVTLKVDGFDNPIDYLISSGYLAKPNYAYYNFKSEDMYANDALIRRLEDGKDFDKKTLIAMGADINRNLMIFEMVRDLNKRHSKIIIFCTSVEHSHLIASILKTQGYNAKAVTSDNSPEYRKKTIASFKSNNEDSLNIIVNFGILTTGFDAPRASAAIIARPTQSVVLYSQMVGRVLRGPNSNGTESCEVYTIVDEIQGFRSIYEGFSHWDDFWN